MRFGDGAAISGTDAAISGTTLQVVGTGSVVASGSLTIASQAIVVSGPGALHLNGGGVSISANTTLQIDSNVTVASDATIAINLVDGGGLTNNGSITSSGTGSGSIVVQGPGSVSVGGTGVFSMTGSGGTCAFVAGGALTGEIQIGAGSTLQTTGGDVRVFLGGVPSQITGVTPANTDVNIANGGQVLFGTATNNASITTTGPTNTVSANTFKAIFDHAGSILGA